MQAKLYIHDAAAHMIHKQSATTCAALVHQQDVFVDLMTNIASVLLILLQMWRKPDAQAVGGEPGRYLAVDLHVEVRLR